MKAKPIHGSNQAWPLIVFDSFSLSYRRNSVILILMFMLVICNTTSLGTHRFSFDRNYRLSAVSYAQNPRSKGLMHVLSPGERSDRRVPLRTVATGTRIVQCSLHMCRLLIQSKV